MKYKGINITKIENEIDKALFDSEREHFILMNEKLLRLIAHEKGINFNNGFKFYYDDTPIIIDNSIDGYKITPTHKE